MSWLSKTLSSTIGKKFIMAGTGLFLITFLIVHLIGNFQLLANDGGESFNKYAYLMTHNPFIKTVSYGLYAFILIHTVYAILLTIQNKKARPVEYQAFKNRSTWASRSMMLLGSLLFFFILTHMKDFWYKYKFTELPFKTYGGEIFKDLYTVVFTEFHEPFHVIIYVIAQVVLAFHLSHGFASAFQTFGINHKKYTPLINGLGLVYSIAVPFGFAIIPILMFMM